MAGDINFYGGADYKLEPKDNENFLGFEYRFPASQFGVPTDPRTSNQIKAVSDKLNTGAKTIEVSGVTTEVLDSIPRQHLKEINRLRKLVGVDLTFHGPLVEPTGITRQGWDESQRRQSETQMWNAVQRSHDLDPKGNTVVTFHSSNQLPETELKVYNEVTKKEEIKEFMIVDERSGQFGNIPIRENFLKGKTKPEDELKKRNEEEWINSLQNVNYYAYQGAAAVDRAIDPRYGDVPEKLRNKKAAFSLYKKYLNGEADAEIKNLGEDGKKVENVLREITNGDIYLRDAYSKFQEVFNRAYDTTKSAADKGGERAISDLQKLDEYREEIRPRLKELEQDPSKLDELGEQMVKGVNVLRAIETPKLYRPLKDFAIEKASETFANIAVRSYKEFKDSSPIISIENPPAGIGLSRADEIKKVIVEARKKFAEKAMEEMKMSKSEAEKQAEKLIGATWDVGHINMIRKYGYSKEDVVGETRKIAPYVKHIHLSDNFGLDHTELPMGMGNVPTKQMLGLISEYNKKAKKIVETGGAWFRDFKTTPLLETFEAFGSPVYSMKLAPFWNQTARTSGSYFAGYGNNPDVHHSMYGAGFGNLPVELGGQMSGRNRLSGSPME